jgi:hypothetical protein
MGVIFKGVGTRGVSNYTPPIIASGLQLFLDAGDPASYPGTGTSWLNRTGATGASTLSGTYAYETSTYPQPIITLNNNGSASNGQVAVVTQDLNALAQTYNFTVMFAARKRFFGVTGNNNGVSQLFQGASNGYTTGWRIGDANQGTPGAAFSGTHSWFLGFNDITTSISINDTQANRMCIVAFTVTSSTLLAFCNGQSNSIVNPQTYAGGASAPQISFTGAGAGSFNGDLGFFAIYNRALSITELQQNYNTTCARYGLAPSTLFTANGTIPPSFDGWINNGVGTSATVGNPTPSFSTTTPNAYAYKSTGAFSLVNKTIIVDMRTNASLIDFFFGCFVSGAGNMVRIDTRGFGNYSGFATTTSWTVWAAPSTGIDTHQQGVWYRVKIQIFNTQPGGMTWYVDGQHAGTGTFVDSGDFIGLQHDGLGGTNYWDNIQIINGIA